MSHNYEALNMGGDFPANGGHETVKDLATSTQELGVVAMSGAGRPRPGRSRLLLDGSWQELANCKGVDPDLFFPERGASTREAKEVCRGCVVLEDCLEFALTGAEKFGVWGGMSERERRRIRRQRSAERQTLAATPTETPE